MTINNFGSKRKSYFWWLVISISILLAFTVSIGSRGAHYIANRSSDPIYTWKSGALQVWGGVVPDTCALTTKKCVCNLSKSVSSCAFNFSFYELSADAFIDVKRKQGDPSIIVNKSVRCSHNKVHQIQNCFIDFRWNKKEPANESISIVMGGSSGIQPIVNLQISAK